MSSMMTADDDLKVERDQSGNITVVDPAAAAQQQQGATEIGDDDDSVLAEDEHDENLAEQIAGMSGGEQALDRLAADLVSAVERDNKSRERWKKTLANGIRLMGVSPDRMKGANFKGSSRVVHPVLTEAAVQFQARAMAEMWPPAGPVKTHIPGTITAELEKRQKNVENYMNWQYTVDMPEAYWELDQMLLWLPLEGSTFKQQYFDALLMRTTTRFLPSKDVIVSNRATDLMTAPRVTVQKRVRENTMKQYMEQKIFRQLTLVPGTAAADLDNDDDVDEAIASSEGRDDDDGVDDTSGTPISNEEFLNYEIRVDVDLFGYEDKKFKQVVDTANGGMIDDPEDDGRRTYIGLPYIVTVNRDMNKILSIVRNWDRDDVHKRKLMDLTHYKYLPGFGFYGYGLLHTIGSLADAATGALRALLDSAAFANMQGGFKTKDIKIGDKGELVVAPGQWIDVPATVDDIRKGLYALPYKEPSETLFKLLGALVEYAQRFASTTEAMVGDASNTGPVGTTLALIEQGSKVFSGIHKRLHKAQGEEFQQIGKLNRIHIPEEGVTFHYAANDNTITREDFDPKIDIVPVSDPNIFSQTQRVTMAQGIKQLAETDKSGKRYDMYQVDKNMLQAMRVPESTIDLVLKNPSAAIPSLSPVYENMLMIQNHPIQAYSHQDHKSHMIAHATFFNTVPPDLQKPMMAAYEAHMAEHTALLYYQQVCETMGIQLPPPPQFQGPDAEKSMKAIQMPPDLENKVAMAAAIAGQKAMQENAAHAQAQQQQQVHQDNQQQDQARQQENQARQHADEGHQQQQRQKDEAFARDQDRKDKATVFDMARKKAQAIVAARTKPAPGGQQMRGAA